MVDFLDRLEEVPATLQALHDPERDLALSYGELRQQLKEVAAGLVDQGLHRGQLVGLQLPKGVDYVVAALACWWAGLAFLPLDPGLPGERLRVLAEEAAPDFLLQQLPRGLPQSRRRGSLAYVIATSGSSGRPKAVEIEHRGLLAMLDDQVNAFQLSETSRSLWMLSIQFDASLSDLCTTLLAGGCLVIPPEHSWERLPEVLCQHSITHLDAPPALLRAFQPGDFPDALQTLIVGGEPSDPPRLRRWAERFRVVSVYGPTEATICSSLRLVGPDWDRPYLGRPIGGTKYRVVEGELWIAGPLLARGYRNQPQLSQQVFVQRDGQRWYRSGDRVETANDDLVFLGRTDQQVKVRGHRIEVEEIEQHLLGFNGMVRAVVVARGGSLLAFYQGDPTVAEVRGALSELLPGWMLPDAIERRESLPLLPSGKVDRAALLPGVTAPLDSLQALQHIALLQSRGQLARLEEWLHSTPLKIAAHHLPSPPNVRVRPKAPGRPRHILMTGATGLLGSAWLRQLSRCGYQVTLLGRRGVEGYPLMTQDLRQPLELEALEEEIDTVVHCAGDINMLAPFEKLRACNLDAAWQLAEFCRRGRPKTLHHASTLSVYAHSSFRGLALEAAPLDAHVELYGGYTQSKWAAENWLRQSGVELFCYRYGLLCGGEGDFLSRFVKGLLGLGCHPQDTHPRLDLTPVGWAVEASQRFFQQQQPGTIHIAHPRGASLQDILAVLQEHGHRLRAVSAGEFFSRPPQDPDQGAAQLALARLHPNPEFRQQHLAMDLFPMEGLQFELQQVGRLKLPELPEGKELVRRCMGWS